MKLQSNEATEPPVGRKYKSIIKGVSLNNIFKKVIYNYISGGEEMKKLKFLKGDLK